MGSRFPLPAEGRIESLIAESFDRMPGPEPARIARAGDRLPLRAPPLPLRSGLNRLPWWIVVMALAGSAAAAWYAGETWRRGPDPVEEAPGLDERAPPQDARVSPIAPPETVAPHAGSGKENGTTDRRPEVIYRREGG